MNDQYRWQFFVDTDFAGNAEVQNKRRSQVGILALLNSAPVCWKSSVIQCYANEDFDEDHPDRSSGASETRGAGNATMDFLHLSYIGREAGIKFPKPFVLQIDNDAARIFANDTCFRSRMKHIDCGQEWVRILRDKAICRPTWLALLTISQTSSPRYFLSSPFALCEAALLWSVQAELSIIFIEIKKVMTWAMMNSNI